MKPILVLLVGVLLLDAGAASSGRPPEQNMGQGHLTMRSLSPGHILRPGITLVTLPFYPADTLKTGLSLTWGNVWNYRRDQFVIDGEWLVARAEAVYFLSDEVAAGISIPVSKRFGGILDSTIESFHETFGYDTAGRENRPRDEVLIDVTSPEGGRTTLEGRSAGINDIPLFFSLLMSEGDARWPAVALQLGLTVPVGDESEVEGVGGVVYGAGMVASKRLGQSRHLAFLGVNVSVRDQGTWAGVELRREEYALLLGWEYQASRALSLLAQYLYTSPLAEDYFEFSDATHEINAGLKWRLTERTTLEWAVSENLFNYQNSADAGMHLGWHCVF